MKPITDYSKYLKSIHWKQFRKFILRERGSSCEECGISNVWSYLIYGQPVNVHHKTYDNIGAEKPSDVLVLCRRCHEVQHGRFTLPDASAIFWDICRQLKGETPGAAANAGPIPDS